VLWTRLDDDDAERIDGRALSLGSHGYVQICPPDGEGRCVLLHRWLMGATARDGRLVDHADRDKLNNQRRTNLEFVTPAESSANVAARARSGYRGVTRQRSGRWLAKGKRGGQQYYLGTYDDIETAAQVAHDWRVANLPGYREASPQRSRI